MNKKTLFSCFTALTLALLIFSCQSKKNITEEPVVESTTEQIEEELPDSLSKDDLDAVLITEGLGKLEGVTIRRIDPQNSFFKSMYELQIEQPVDHLDASKGSFNQKVYLSHMDFNQPMVMYLNGYTAGSNSYTTEAAEILGANQIHVEHRFFSDSRPKDGIPWEYLTIKQAAHDHHRVTEVLKTLYKKPWLSTGISKGGMVTIFHKRYFPDDVQVAMPYVAPINFERHDPRIYEHLKTVGTKECRDKVTVFQRSLLAYYDESLELFKQYSKKAGYKYPHGYEASFELSVFEFSFAFWQWSGDCNRIPAPESTVEDKMKFLFYSIDAPSFFNESTLTGILPFFYQGYREIGMYGYEVEEFKNLTRVYKEEVDNYYTFIPEEITVEYTAEPIKEIVSWLDENGNNMIYIYGEYDPWGATAYQPTEKTNSLYLELPAGNHSTRLQNFPRNQRAAAMDSLKTWMKPR